MGQTDDIFRAAGVADPFLDETSPYLAALLDLPPRERRIVVRQVVLLCMAIEGLDPEGALELLGRLGVWMNFREDKNGRKKT